LEVEEKLELAQQNLFTKAEVVQRCYLMEDLSLKKIYIKERESNVAQAMFQEAILMAAKDEMENIP
jgi:hypothetical protein